MASNRETCGLTKRNYTFSEARSFSRRFGVSLLDRGLNPGDVLVVMLPNAIDNPIILLGALEAGLLVTTIDPAYKKNELSLQVRTIGAKVIVAIPTVVPLVKAVLEELGVTMPIILVDLKGEETGHDFWSYRDLISRSDGTDTQRKWPEVSPEDIAILLSSSGTTGERKMVARTHRNTVATMVLSGVYGKNRIISGSIVFGLTEVWPLFMALQNDQNPLNLGYPEPNTELKVIDTCGKSLRPGEVGELCIRGPQVGTFTLVSRLFKSIEHYVVIIHFNELHLCYFMRASLKSGRIWNALMSFLTEKNASVKHFSLMSVNHTLNESIGKLSAPSIF
ncbi:unnamed protein product [Bemisia tabaci]|uniref:AMP-dependent synthetase/ligase domain-containing protein n=1 Tax=Bemisia tabaci TaxID=7038 RepID=A0AAI8UTY7_BEMTA|nr:unnamed protein product [Bemisia tabaci]